MKRPLPAAALLFAMTLPLQAADITITPRMMPEMKAVFGTVAARDVVPARARLGGTITQLAVEEGSAVKAGDVLATVVDDKLALQLQASEANINSISAQLQNAETELQRVQRLSAAGVATKAALDSAQTQRDVLEGQMKAAEAAKAVLEQQASEGKVLAPAEGRVLTVPVTKGSVVMPGEAVATLASGQYYLRLLLPERHAGQLKEGAAVQVGADGAAPGKLVKLYPQIEGGKVAADVVVEGLGDYFVGQRVLVSIPVDQRQVILIPAASVTTRSGLDYVTLAAPQSAEVPVIIGQAQTVDGEKMVEILSGLKAGDKVVAP